MLDLLHHDRLWFCSSASVIICTEMPRDAMNDNTQRLHAERHHQAHERAAVTLTSDANQAIRVEEESESDKQRNRGKLVLEGFATTAK